MGFTSKLLQIFCEKLKTVIREMPKNPLGKTHLPIQSVAFVSAYLSCVKCFSANTSPELRPPAIDCFGSTFDSILGTVGKINVPIRYKFDRLTDFALVGHIGVRQL